MRLGITAKLFSAVLASFAIVLLVYGSAAEIGFQRGFLGYLNEQGVERMGVIIPRLEMAYRTHGDWEFLRGDLRSWFNMLPPEHDPTRKSSGPPISDQTGATNRFALLGPDLQVIVGHPRGGQDSLRKPIFVDGDRVGWLAMVPFERAVDPGDMRFAQEQRRMWLLIGLLTIIVAAFLAALVSRTLLRRVHEMKVVTGKLLEGELSSRVPVGPRDELGELANDFNQMAAAFERNDTMRRNFMADISHELRTPLGVIRAEIEAMEDGIRPLALSSLAPVDQHARRLEKLVDDLHTLAVTDAGAMNYERNPVDLSLLLNGTLSSWKLRFTDAGLSLQSTVEPGPLPLVGDERRLHQLFSNLLENSLRYTNAGGMLQVSCARRLEGLIVSFDDSAPTVPEDKLPHLFERFYRADLASRGSNRGSGLGMAICRNIVEAHGGYIQARRSELGGLRIVLILPEAA